MAVLISLVAFFVSIIALHLWEVRKINEFSKTFETLSEIELKRTSLMVLQQQVLQNVVREVENNKIQKLEKPDFKLPDKLDTMRGKGCAETLFLLPGPKAV